MPTIVSRGVAAFSILLTASAHAQYLRGVNLSGAEFGQSEIPGVFGVDYTYNSETSFRYFAAKNLGLIRLPLRWERLQPVLGGPLDPGNVALLKGDLAWAAAHGANVIIDIHNYGRYSINENGALNSYVLDNVYGGVTKVTGADLADFWTKMSSEFKGLPGVYAYDLMNEPHDMGTANWQAISQAVVSAIRANGDGTLIMVESDNWSGAYSWPTINGPASWISDPMANFIYEAHQYFDSDNSGTYAQSYDAELSKNPNLANVGVTRLKPFLGWCTNNNVRGYLGEYGIPNTDARWMTVLDNFLTSLDSAGYDGTYWAAGEWWKTPTTDYPLSVQPLDDFTVDRVQLAVLARHLPAQSFTSLPAGSFSGAFLAPNSLAVGYGAALSTMDAAVAIKDTNSNVTMAQVLYEGATQINYLVPASLTPGHYEINVSSGGAVVAHGFLELNNVAPSLFAANGNGQGVAAAQILRISADGTQSYEAVAQYDASTSQFVPLPIDFGASTDQLFLILYGTGFRNVSGLSGVTLLIGPDLVSVLYAGSQGAFAGLDQINAALPRSLAGSGEVTISVTVDGTPANPVTVAFL
jgi:endoglucanase